MPRLLSLAGIVVLAVGMASAAQAFSLDQRNDRNSDGTAKFADPDEQMPNFVISPEAAAASVDHSATRTAPTTLTQPSDTTSGAAAFDRAYAHQNSGR